MERGRSITSNTSRHPRDHSVRFQSAGIPAVCRTGRFLPEKRTGHLVIASRQGQSPGCVDMQASGRRLRHTVEVSSAFQCAPGWDARLQLNGKVHLARPGVADGSTGNHANNQARPESDGGFSSWEGPRPIHQKQGIRQGIQPQAQCACSIAGQIDCGSVASKRCAGDRRHCPCEVSD